jgi:hypothetical protein
MHPVIGELGATVTSPGDLPTRFSLRLWARSTSCPRPRRRLLLSTTKRANDRLLALRSGNGSSHH